MCHHTARLTNSYVSITLRSRRGTGWRWRPKRDRGFSRVRASVPGRGGGREPIVQHRGAHSVYTSVTILGRAGSGGEALALLPSRPSECRRPRHRRRALTSSEASTPSCVLLARISSLFFSFCALPVSKPGKKTKGEGANMGGWEAAFDI